MAVSRKVEREIIRTDFLERVSRFLYENGEEVLRVKSNEIAVPVVGCEGNEDFLVLTFKVPTGANKGLEPYDAYSEAESYELKLKEKAEKAKANAEKKERKRLRDEEIRRKKAEISEKGGQQTVLFLFGLTSKAAASFLRRHTSKHTMKSLDVKLCVKSLAFICVL